MDNVCNAALRESQRQLWRLLGGLTMLALLGSPAVLALVALVMR